MPPRLNQFCWGPSLKTGTNIIAALQFFESVVQIAVTAHFLDGFEYYVLILEDLDIQAKMIVLIVSGVIRAICSVPLLIGANKEKANMLLPWMVVEALALIIFAVIGIIVCIDLQVFSSGYLIGAILLVPVRLYFLLVVYSYYQSLREDPITDMDRERAPLLSEAGRC